MIKPTRHFGKAVIGQDIYVVSKNKSYGDLEIVVNNSLNSVNWKITSQYRNMRCEFSVCSFKQNLFIIVGTSYISNKLLDRCLKFDVKLNKWSSITNTNERRSKTACTVFYGKIVISGGFNSELVCLKSVEAYDHHEDKWNFLPDMLFERCGHSAVSMGNKMFIIGGFVQGNSTFPCEVYDKISNEFTCIESPGIDMMSKINVMPQPYCVGNKIVLITRWYENTVSYRVYNVDKNSWSTHEKQLI